jgi:rubredoxin
MKDQKLYKFNFKGGIAYIGVLKTILWIAAELGIKDVKSSLRQQMLVLVPDFKADEFEKMLEKENIEYLNESKSKANIVSSYVAEEVFQTGNWLTENIYKDILDTFEKELTLKINISDNSQSFTPFFSGHLNFVAAEEPNYWHVFVRLPKTNQVHSFDKLIFTNEIARFAYLLESRILEGKILNISQVFSNLPTFISIPKKSELKLPRFSLPYYEGLNRYGKKTWLGIYSRSENFSIPFLLDIIELCIQNKVGEICFTPWKSIIIKGINEGSREAWTQILANYNINVRHAANELNWQVEDDSEQALALKTELANYFNRIDIRTFGICFGIKTIPKTEVFASIMVEKVQKKILNFFPLLPTYHISYTEDFDPNGRTKKYFARYILKVNLKEQLRRSVLFYNKSKPTDIQTAEQIPQSKPTENQTYKAHQCGVCFTIYDAHYGDILNNIQVGTTFKKLPESYCCSVCGEGKVGFKAIEMSGFLDVG